MATDGIFDFPVGGGGGGGGGGGFWTPVPPPPLDRRMKYHIQPNNPTVHTASSKFCKSSVDPDQLASHEAS